jgi:hypothetical protein
MSKKEAMHYAELANGQLDKEIQAAFLEVQGEAERLGVNAEITVKLSISPRGQEQFGAVGWTIGRSFAKRKARAMHTMVNEDGHIFADGSTQIEAQNEKLELLPISPRRNGTHDE